MDSTSTSSFARACETDLAEASSHLKESWEQGKEAVLGAKRAARSTLRELWRDIERRIEARPKTIALEALAAGMVVGILGGLLLGRVVRAASD